MFDLIMHWKKFCTIILAILNIFVMHMSIFQDTLSFLFFILNNCEGVCAREGVFTCVYMTLWVCSLPSPLLLQFFSSNSYLLFLCLLSSFPLYFFSLSLSISLYIKKTHSKALFTSNNPPPLPPHLYFTHKFSSSPKYPSRISSVAVLAFCHLRCHDMSLYKTLPFG